MKLKYKIIIYAVCAGACMLTGYLLSEYMMPPTEIQIVEKTKTVTEYINRPTTDEECWKCMNNPLELDGKIEKSILHAWASDGCRKSERDFILKATARGYKNVFQLNYTYDFFNQAHGGSILYFRKFGRIGVGGGVSGSQNSAGIIGAAQYEF